MVVYLLPKQKMRVRFSYPAQCGLGLKGVAFRGYNAVMRTIHEAEPRIRSERTAAADRLIGFLVEHGYPEEDIRRLIQSADAAGILGSPTIPDCADTLAARFPEAKARN